MKKWKFGIVGAGLIADFHARAIQDLPNAALVGVYDMQLDRARQLAANYSAGSYETIESLLPDVEIITIATPSGAHLAPAIAAAQAGVHVLCEKPLEIALDRIDTMIAAHQKAETLLGGIFQNRFNAAMIPLREAVMQGRFGAVTYAGVFVPWWRNDEYYQGSWHGTWQLDGGGALMNQSIHMVDMLIDLMGLPASVQAYTATLGHKIEAEDTAVAVLRFPNEALGMIYGTTASWPGQFKRFEITGTKGTVVYLEDSFSVWQFADEQEQDEEIRKRFGQIETKGGGVSDPAAISYQNHMKNFAAFLQALESGCEFEIGGAEARKSVELIQAIYTAAQKGKIVQLDNRS
ncbi:MAG: Gfo/Idh/MocA family oxidoreductase [Sedimentisphaerales bacterium]|nr:Gfo/Idh/MocA family oxidoreductase [Sedimentisphaerales bacterium]